MEVRANHIEIGQTFKKSIQHNGTVTFKALSKAKQSRAYKNEYIMMVLVLDATVEGFYKTGKQTILTFSKRNSKLGKITLLKTA